MSASSLNHRSAKRRRRVTSPLSPPDPLSSSMHRYGAEEERPSVAPPSAPPPTAARAVSLEEGSSLSPWSSIPHGPTFYPTVEDFAGDPLTYLEKIRPIAERYGICKIVPPEGWNPPFSLDVNNPHRLETKRQSIHRLQEGISFGDGKEYTVKEYQRMSSEWSKEWKGRYYPQAGGGNDEKDGGENGAKGGERDGNEQGGEIKAGGAEKVDISATATPGRGGGLDGESTGAKASVDGALGTPDMSTSAGGARTVSAEGMQVKHQLQQRGKGGPNPKGTTATPVPSPRMTPHNLERDFWDIVETRSKEIDVDYGNDVDTADFGSGFPISNRGRAVNSPNFQVESDGDGGEEAEPAFGTEEYYRETYWNLNNIPNAKNSILRHVKVGINGINVPWLYFGSLFSTFCWHTEDNYLYSINYHHKGAPKQWYGVPGTKQYADGVERVFKNCLSMKMRDVPDLMHHITTMFSPRLLQQEGVNACKLTQNAGEYVVTFPRAFHGGFSLGPNVGEAVNFATHDWIHHGADANERYRSFARPSVFSHDRLIYTIAHHASKLQTASVCDSLANELRRLAKEELLLRAKLTESGVRDVSDQVELPSNRLDRLDEESADYDDKRLCHSCKHICFFSAVACECSERKVSCLRHSHFMCRCSISRKYLLIWTTEKEMTETISDVEKRSKELKASNTASEGGPSSSSADVVGSSSLEEAPGSESDRESHQNREVSVEPVCPIDDVAPPQISTEDNLHSSKPLFRGGASEVRVVSVG